MSLTPFATLVLVGCASASGSPAPPRTPDSPEAAVRRYFAASDQASAPLLREAFHPSAWMQSVDDAGALRIVPQLAWWQRLAGKPSPATTRELEVVDREGKLALVRATSIWPTKRFDDLLVTVDTGERWQIVAKVFATVPTPLADDDRAAIERVVADKIAAHARYDVALLARSHTEHCPYFRVDPTLSLESISEAAARYAANAALGKTSRAPWRTLLVVGTGTVAAVKLDVVFEGTRYIDYLLLVRLADGWRITAAVWGDPT